MGASSSNRAIVFVLQCLCVFSFSVAMIGYFPHRPPTYIVSIQIVVVLGLERESTRIFVHPIGLRTPIDLILRR